MTVSVVLGVIVALAGSGGILFGALRFNREEATRVVGQQAQILDDMRDLYEVTRTERDALREEVRRCSDEIERLNKSIRGSLWAQLQQKDEGKALSREVERLRRALEDKEDTSGNPEEQEGGSA